MRVLATGAYHEDGSAVVIAEDVEQAIHLLSAVEDGPYSYSEAAREAMGKSTYFMVRDVEPPRVVAYDAGCDC